MRPILTRVRRIPTSHPIPSARHTRRRRAPPRPGRGASTGQEDRKGACSSKSARPCVAAPGAEGRDINKPGTAMVHEAGANPRAGFVPCVTAAPPPQADARHTSRGRWKRRAALDHCLRLRNNIKSKSVQCSLHWSSSPLISSVSRKAVSRQSMSTLRFTACVGVSSSGA